MDLGEVVFVLVVFLILLVLVATLITPLFRSPVPSQADIEASILQGIGVSQ